MRQVVLDTETTGISAESGHRIIEIGVVEILDRRLTGNDFQTYLNPERKIDPATIPIHGITDDFVSDKPKFSEVITEFIEFVEGAEVIMHNAPFDSSFINKELELLGYKDRLEDLCQITDSLNIAREKHPGQRNSLDALVNRYDINGYDRELHGALLDSKILGDVYLSMTGGQSDLDFSTTDENEHNSSLSQDQTSSGKKLKVIKVTAKEKARNLEYLSKMKEETDVEPIWNLEHE